MIRTHLQGVAGLPPPTAHPSPLPPPFIAYSKLSERTLRDPELLVATRAHRLLVLRTGERRVRKPLRSINISSPGEPG